MRTRLLALLLASTLLTVVGCSDDNADVSTGSTSQEASVSALEGKTFVSTEVTGHTLVPDTQVTVSFQAGAVRFNAGCNSIGGTYTIDNGVLEGGESFSSTMMGCEPALSEQDVWLSGFIGASPTVSLDGDSLTMTAKDTTITFVNEQSSAIAAPLVGTTWTLESMVSIATQAVSSLPAGVEPPTLVLGADGQASITTGCNTGGASYTDDGQTITFGPMRLTKMACIGEAKTVEPVVLAVLDGDVTYTIEGTKLHLTKGDQGLIYRAP